MAAQIILTEAVVGTIQREMRKLLPNLKVDHEHTAELLLNDTSRRGVIEDVKVKDIQEALIKRLLASWPRSIERE